MRPRCLRGLVIFLGKGLARYKVYELLSMCGGDAAFCQITLTISFFYLWSLSVRPDTDDRIVS